MFDLIRSRGSIDSFRNVYSYIYYVDEKKRILQKKFLFNISINFFSFNCLLELMDLFKLNKLFTKYT